MEKTQGQLGQVRLEVGQAVEEYGLLPLLFGWLVELAGFSGYLYKDALGLAQRVLSEMGAAFPGNEKLLAKLSKFREKLPKILLSLERPQAGLEREAGEKGIPPEAFSILYYEKALPPLSCEYNQLEYGLGAILGDRYEETKEEFSLVLASVKRASSLVGNLNSRIRVYMDLKRRVPERYFVLMKVYFNTKKYRRSRVPGRIGKSPLELMTGQPYPELLDVLGY